MDLEFSSYINFAILTHCIFSVVYLATQWQRNRWLILFIAILFVGQLGIFITDDNLSFAQKLLIGNPGMVLWLLPSMYFFTKELVCLNTSGREVALHFIVGAIFYFIFLFTETSQPEQFFTLFSRGDIRYNHVSHIVVVILSTLYYAHAILSLIRYNKVKFKNIYAEENIYLSLNWLRYTIWTAVTVIIIGFFLMVISSYFGSIPLQVNVIEVSFLLLVMTISYFSFRQPTIYQKAVVEDHDGRDGDYYTNEHKRKISKTVFSKDELSIISEKLDSFIKRERPYLDIDVRLPDIARAMDMSSSNFSIYLNDYYGMNFFTFINTYRVKYAAELLKGEKNSLFTLEAISKMSGFRSKTTFNTRFKEIMIQTPSVYRKEHRSPESSN